MNFKKIKDSSDLIYELNSLYAEELVAWYQYHAVAPFLCGEDRVDVEDFFSKTAEDELHDHADKLITRIQQLGGTFMLPTLESVSNFAHCETASPDDLDGQLNLNLQAEAQAIAHYQRVIQIALAVADYVTADILKSILADEEEHLIGLKRLMEDRGLQILIN